jgi:hypothetical protein
MKLTASWAGGNTAGPPSYLAGSGVGRRKETADIIPPQELAGMDSPPLELAASTLAPCFDACVCFCSMHVSAFAPWFGCMHRWLHFSFMSCRCLLHWNPSPNCLPPAAMAEWRLLHFPPATMAGLLCFRQCEWRVLISASPGGGYLFPPLPVAERATCHL